MNPVNATPKDEPGSGEETEAIASKTTAMASDGDETREAAAVGRRLLGRYGDDSWEARVARKIDTGIYIAFSKKNRGRTWTPFVEWRELAEDADQLSRG